MADVATSVESFVINELLCYLQNNFSKSTTNGLITAISGFYTVDEILLAKCRIYEMVKQAFVACDLDTADLPRYMTRRGGDNKRRLDTSDIV